jgi:FkbM family methyltransferase
VVDQPVDGSAIMFQNLLNFRQDSKQNPDNAALKFIAFCMQNNLNSYSQLFQDLFVLFVLKSKRNGFFVEFGATDGISLSNTYLLEREFRWRGILAEPAKCWHPALRSNRKCKIDTRCVWSTTGELLDFSEASLAELSTISEFTEKDFNRDERKTIDEYCVPSISINDLLKTYEAPKQIDFMSIDTEGSEFRILKSLDFSKYEPKIITVEHNYTSDREEIKIFLSIMGYVRVFDALSQWDDWYVKESLLERI